MDDPGAVGDERRCSNNLQKNESQKGASDWESVGPVRFIGYGIGERINFLHTQGVARGNPTGGARSTCFHFTSFARRPSGEFPFTHGHNPWNSALRVIRITY